MGFSIAAPSASSKSLSRMRTIAWNGIRCSLPRSWQPTRIGLDHLAFEDEHGPVLEVRWSPLRRGRKKQTALYNRLKRTAKSNHCHIQLDTLPESWRQSLPQYTLSRFSWHGEAIAAEGVMIICPQCGRTTLLQFYHLPGKADLMLIERILATFKDHQNKGMMLWSLFDIELSIPQEFQLVTYQFNAGAFFLSFKHRGTTVDLYRFAPADVILKQASLLDFAEHRWPGDPHHRYPHENDTARHALLTYPTTSSAPLLKRMLCKLAGKSITAWVQVRHVKNANRIMAVRVEGKGREIKRLLCTTAERFSHVQKSQKP